MQLLKQEKTRKQRLQKLVFDQQDSSEYTDHVTKYDDGNDRMHQPQRSVSMVNDC